MSTMIWRPALAAFFCAFLLVSCGGGGGDGDAGSQDNTQTDSTVTVDQTNGAGTAANAMEGDALASNNSSSLVGTLGTDPQYVLTDLTDIGRLLHGMLDTGSGELAAQNHILTCDNAGGSIDDSGAGENSGTLRFTDCVLVGITFNGTVTYNKGSSFALDFNNLRLSSSGDLVVMDGDISIRVANVDFIETTTISGNRITITTGGHHVRLISYEIVTEDDGGNITEEFDYVFDSSIIGGRVRVTTASAEGGAPLVRRSDQSYPRTGTVVVIGEGDTRVKITSEGPLSTDNVSIEFDENGDGTYETSQSMTWASFMALAVVNSL